MARVRFGFDAYLEFSEQTRFGLEFTFAVGQGPAQFSLAPSKKDEAYQLAEMIEKIAVVIDVDELKKVGSLGSKEPWSKIFGVCIRPELLIQLSKATAAVECHFRLYEDRSASKYGIKLGGQLAPGIKMEPEITVYDLIVGYNRDDGLDVKARVHFGDQDSELVQTRLGGSEPEGKTEIVSYPFPLPSEGSKQIQVKYFGLGQRFGPTVDMSAPDPLKKMFDDLEKLFVTNDPSTLLGTLVKDYYHPDRGWFVAADIYIRGWEVRAVFNDPALYGLEITCDSGDQFKGFKFEILYQKLGPKLGVYYGAITIPEQFRHINLGAVALTLPSFEIWVYTNGDFKVSVGWPLGENSIGVEIYIFTGGCAFYFAKLRSGDNPQTHDPEVYYNPILAFGLGVWLGVGRSIRKGVLSASLSLTLRATFQGILAWKGTPPPSRLLTDGSSAGINALTVAGGSISRAPDYYWFAATVGVVGVLQGEVDLKILKVSVLVRLSVTTGIAFETDYGSKALVSAHVEVKASIKIVFVTITASFSATITERFQLSSGPKGQASIEGPQNPSFGGIVPSEKRLRLVAPATPIITAADVAAGDTPDPVTLSLLLQPTAVYDGEKGVATAVASLIIGAPGGEGDKDSDLEVLVRRLAKWLLREYSDGTREWSVVEANLGIAHGAPPAGFEQKLVDFLGQELSFTIDPVDLTSTVEDEVHVALFPMFNELAMSYTGSVGDVVFEDWKRTWPDYSAVVAEYFEELSINGLMANPRSGPELFGTGAAEGDTPTGPSMAGIMFVDYFLMLGRDLARRMDDAKAGALPDRETVAQVGGMASRFLLHGLLLPDPADVNKDIHKVDLHNLTLGGIYALTGQQFAVGKDESVCEATLKIHDSQAPLAKAISFPGKADSVTSKLPMQAVPPRPSPTWHSAESLAAAVADITVRQMPAISQRELWIATREHPPWDAAGDKRMLAALPPDVMSLAAKGPVMLTVRKDPPDAGDQVSADTIAAEPVLAMQFAITRVGADNINNVDESGQAKDDYLPNLYQVQSTDDETRDRIEALLEGADMSGATLQVLYNAEHDGYRSDTLKLSEPPVYLVKTNLSTSSQPDGLETPLLMRRRLRAGTDALGPVTASLSEAQGFLRLLWEASVVNAGGFYLHYENADGDGLPKDIFDGDTATLTVVATLAGKGQPVRTWHNALSVAGRVKESLYVGVTDDKGNRVQSYQPAYPPGCVGVEIDWSLPQLAAPDEVTATPFADENVAALYHMIQFRVEDDDGAPFKTSLWSASLSPSSDEPGGAGKENYRQVLPLYRFAKTGVRADDDAPDVPPVYDAIGEKAPLRFRLLDIYGNVLEDDTYRQDFQSLYNDPLVSPAEWPGLQASYWVGKGEKGTPVLTLALAYDPAQILREGARKDYALHGVLGGVGDDADKIRQQAEVAVFKYRTVIAQLRDPNTDLALQTSLFGEAVAVGDAKAMRAKLLGAAEGIYTQLAKVAVSGDPKDTHAMQWGLPADIDPAKLKDRKEDLFALTTWFVLSRDEKLVDPKAAKRLPKAQCNRFVVPPKTDFKAEQSADGDSGSARMSEFTVRCEAVFKGFDGGDGQLKLAVRTGDPDLSDTGNRAYLWGLRWSKIAGVYAHFPTEKFVYYSFAPLSTSLQNGPATVPVAYDDKLDPTEQKRIFSNVDIDQWGRRFLERADYLLSARLAAAIASVDADAYAKLMDAKALLARAIAKGLEPVFTPRDDKGKDGGDLDGARDYFEQALLTRLGTAYGAAALLQTPAEVTVNGVVEGGADEPPRLFGNLGIDGKRNAKPSPADRQKTYSTTSGKLELKAAMEKAPRHLNSLVSVKEPERQATLDLDLIYEAGFIEHLFETDEKTFGYTPSSWLRVILSDEDSPLRFPLGNAQVPIPIRRYPSSPVLQGQTADQTKGKGESGALADRLKWDYTATLRKPGREAADDLWLRLTFNSEVDAGAVDKRFGQRGVDEVGEPGDITGLFQALARFETGYPKLKSHVDALPEDDGGDGPSRGKVVQVILGLVQDVAKHWAAYVGLEDEHGNLLFPASFKARYAKPTVEHHQYVVSFRDAYADKKQLDVYADGKDLWPSINGASREDDPKPVPKGEGPSTDRDWWLVHFDYYEPPKDDPRDELIFAWTPLEVIGRETGSSTAWVVRNADLTDDPTLKTNPDFVFQTAKVAFANPAIPLVSIDGYGPVEPQKSLSKTLGDVLTPVISAGSVVAKDRLLKLHADYRYALITDPRAGGAALAAASAVVLADDVVISTADGAGDAISPDAFIQRLTSDLFAWNKRAVLPTGEATLSLNLNLFAALNGIRLPVISLTDIRFTVPEGWWGEE